MSTAVDLSIIKGNLTDLAFAMVDQTSEPAEGILGLLRALDVASAPWGAREQSPEDHYRLGLLLGMVGHMSACRIGPDCSLAPLPVDLGSDDPVVRAVGALRDALLGFPVPSA